MFYPVGSIYMSTSSTNPSTWMKGTIWVRYAKGRVLVGVSESESEFSIVGRTGGEKTHKLTTSEMPNHTHGFNLNIQHSDGSVVSGEALTSGLQVGGRSRYKGNTAAAGEDVAHNNLQPYISVYIWHRTA